MARCEGCGAPRSGVSARQMSRIRTGHSGNLCRVCRGGPIEADEAAYRFWLTKYGVKVPNGSSAWDTVVASGLPPALGDLAKAFEADSFL